MREIAVWNSSVSVQDAAACLSYSEQRVFLGLRRKRQLEWLKGRYVAKQAIQRKVWAETRQNIALSDIEMRSRKGERPSFAFLREISGFDPNAYCLTLSHVDDMAVAALASIKKSGNVGIDIERARIFSESFARAFLTEQEYGRARFSGQEYMLWCWCYKEAFLKAIGTGLRVHPRRIEIVLGEHGQLTNLKKDGEQVAVFARPFQLPGIAFGAIVYEQSYGHERHHI